MMNIGASMQQRKTNLALLNLWKVLQKIEKTKMAFGHNLHGLFYAQKAYEHDKAATKLRLALTALLFIRLAHVTTAHGLP